MAGRPLPITSFTAGEISPLLSARIGQAKYGAALLTCENLIVTPWGPLTRRPGTRFVEEIKNSAALARLLPFQFSTLQAYIVEAGAQYLRFYRDRVRLAVADTDAVVSNGDFTADITGWTDNSGAGGSIAHDAGNGRLSLISDGVDNAEAEQSVATTATAAIHVLAFRVFGIAGDAVDLRIGTTTGGSEILADRASGVGWHTVEFTPGASPFYVQFSHAIGKTLQIDDVALLDNVPMEVAAPWASADLAAIKYAQSADILFLTHPDFRPRELARTGDRSWSVTEYDFRDGPYLPENTSATTLTPSATTGLGITITASATAGINDGQGFLASDIGRVVRIKNGADWGWAVITAITSTTVVTADVRGDFAAVTANIAWRLGLYSDTTGWPAVVTFHQQRQVFAGSAANVQRFDASATGDFNNFAPGALAADPLSVTLDSDQVNAIQWLASSSVLHLGTAGGEARVGAHTDAAPLTPADVNARFDTRYGSADVQPVQAAASLLFLQRTRRKLREMIYNSDQEQFRARDVTRLAEHVSQSGIAQMAFAREPFSALWAVRTDGLLIALTFNPDEDQFGWHRHPLGGSGLAESVAVIPGAIGDEPWLIVNRTIDGGTRRYIEFIEDPWPDDGAQEDAFYVDCGLTYDGAPVTTISGADHLEGEMVRIMVDGAAHPDRVVTAGGFDLDSAASVVHVGFAQTWAMEPTPPQLPDGASFAQKQRVGWAVVQVKDTLGLRLGPDLASAKEIPFRANDDLMDTAIPLFTGFITEEIGGEWDVEARVALTHDGPFPATIVAVVPWVEV